MNIDKIVFSCSPYFAPFWNIQSKIWKTKMGVHPVCLYFSNTKDGMSEEYGDVILKDTDPQFGDDGDIIQVTMSKFWHPTTEPDTVWLIGDIDMLPLQTAYFMDGYSKPQHGDYMHFNMTGIFQHHGVGVEVFQNIGSKTMGGLDFAGHYHLATGKTYQDVIFRQNGLIDVLKEIVFGTRYGKRDGAAAQKIHKNFWCAEENYTSEKIHQALVKHQIQFSGKQYHNIHNRVDRAFWNPNEKKYYHPSSSLKQSELESGRFVDIHCQRPYGEQQEDMMNLLKMANMI